MNRNIIILLFLLTACSNSNDINDTNITINDTKLIVNDTKLIVNDTNITIEPSLVNYKVIDNTFTLANWNIQIFGKSKWSSEETQETIIKIIDQYDIIFVQEIREASGESFNDLCEQLTYHNCEISSRAGRSDSKEQYGIIYRDSIELLKITDFNNGENNNWERPPIKVDFKVNNYKFSAYNIHIKPDDVDNELEHLYNTVIFNSLNTENVIVLGDLNADGTYYNENLDTVFKNYYWIIDDKVDTTVADSDNTYDRIIVNKEAFEEYISHGVHKENIDKDISDHYLVWTKISTGEII